MLARLIKLYFLILSALLLIISCSPGRRLANGYVKNRRPMAILLLTPDFSYKYSYKIPDINKFDSLPVQVQDSLLFYNSELVQYLDDSIILSNYQKGLSSGLKAYGFNVFNASSAENFVNSDTEALILNLTQLQFEEYYDSISEEVSFGDEELYNYDLYITAVNVNSWFEYSKINKNDTLTKILFATNTLYDYFNGGFRYFPFSGDVKYEYTIDSLTTGEIYTSVKDIGLLYSGFLFDYMMNEYIQENLPAGTNPVQLYTYDRTAGVVKKNKSKGFVRIN
jgi:hypothetical protein